MAAMVEVPTWDKLLVATFYIEIVVRQSGTYPLDLF